MRAFTDHAVTALAVLATILVVTPLVVIFGYLLIKGASSLNLAFFTQIPKPEGENGGGMANSIVGSGVLLGLASLIGIPIGTPIRLANPSSTPEPTMEFAMPPPLSPSGLGICRKKARFSELAPLINR